MPTSIDVSVIVPVYNAAKYVRKAVESAVHLPQVAEVILIEDRSPDNALAICTELVGEFSKVKIYQHPNNENRGAGASRNLGIEKSNFPYIAFLDADDYYLPNRFEKASAEFCQNPEIDGVYDAVGYVKDESTTPFKIYSINRPVPYNELFYYLLRGTYGHFHTNGITIKKDVLKKSGLFDASLKLHQDSDLWLKLAYYGKLTAGEISRPVALVRMHGANRITSANDASNLGYWSVVDEYFSDKRIGWVNKMLIKRKIVRLKWRSFLRSVLNNR